MPQEIERKFLAYLTTKPKAVPKRLLQGYLAQSVNTVRLRLEDKVTTLTIKGPGSLSRSEVELVLDPAKAKELWPLCTSSLEKTRYKVNGWDIDVYHGALEGLVTAEYELRTVRSKLPPAPEGLIILAELTEEKGYSNSALASLNTETPKKAKQLVKSVYKKYAKTIKNIKNFRATLTIS